MMATHKRKLPTPYPHPPTPLGVLEFASALNGDDAIQIVKKLHQFVKVVKYERRVALLSSPSNDDDDDIDVGGEIDGDVNDDNDDDISLLSFLDTQDPTAHSFNKRQKLSPTDDNNPSWQTDTQNYNVPFVGTAISKGATGSVTPNSWPTGFLQVYLSHSPNGVELLSNDYISALPPDGGIHKSLCKDGNSSDGGGEFTLKKKKEKKQNKGDTSSSKTSVQSRGQMISMSLQTYYWEAISEWILGFVPLHKLKKELAWEENGQIVVEESTTSSIPEESKCTVPPPIMTILMKGRLPEWVACINKYTFQQNRYMQQLQKEKTLKKKMDQKKNSVKHPQKGQKVEDEHQEEQVVDDQQQQQHDPKLEKKHQREEKLVLSAMHNLIALCHLSDGTAREVLRQLSVVPSAGSSSSKKLTAGKGGGGKSSKIGDGSTGISWMAQLFQLMVQIKPSSSSSLSYQPQIECLRLVCTLLETNDDTIVSRLCTVPITKQGGGTIKRKGKSVVGGSSGEQQKNIGLVYIALRYGIQGLLDIDKIGGNDGEDEDEDRREHMDNYARYMTRLLRNVKEILLPHPSKGSDNNAELDGSRNGFVLGAGATVSVLFCVSQLEIIHSILSNVFLLSSSIG